VKELNITIDMLDFSEHLYNSHFYVDKTRILSDLAGRRKGYAFLVTRPPGFGKTRNLNMIHSFFSNEKSFDHIESVFAGLSVWRNKNTVVYAGRYPVIHISLASIRGCTWEQMLANFKLLVDDWMNDNIEILRNAKMSAFERIIMEKVQRKSIDEGVLESCLFYFTDWMRIIYRQGVIVLIDDYEVPYIEAVNGGYYKEAQRFLGSFFGRGLNDNHNLAFTVITGILEAPGKSLLSPTRLINCNLFSWTLAQFFGFTDSEVRILDILFCANFSDSNVRL
jgi:hypothetical protein